MLRVAACADAERGPSAGVPMSRAAGVDVRTMLSTVGVHVRTMPSTVGVDVRTMLGTAGLRVRTMLSTIRLVCGGGG
jgi:hypothetical protein